VSVSGSIGEPAGVAVSTGSGVALSSGLIEGLGEGFAEDLAVGVGLGFGFGIGVGEGDSSALMGLLAWNGVEAASCARTRTAKTDKIIPITRERIMTVLNFWPTLACARPLGQEPIRLSSRSLINRCTPANKSQWTPRRVATKSSFLMRNRSALHESWR
jgi:hypothetical protein